MSEKILKKVLILGHARHGKDTVADFLKDLLGYKFESSSQAASRIFLYDSLKEKYGYTSPDECFNDRVNHRAEWHDLIADFNKNDLSKLAREILKTSDIYVGMRSHAEIKECMSNNIFDLIIGVYDPRKELEPKSSFNINLWDECDFIIANSGSLNDLKTRMQKLIPLF